VEVTPLPCSGPPVVRASVAWSPPAGIPTPPFGITEAAPALPDPWGRETPCFYLVEPGNPSATDEDNANGTPSRPRLTIPLTLPAGAVVELRGTYDHSHESPRRILAEGTAARPVFIRGHGPEERPRITRPWEVSGSHLVLENLEFTDRDGNEAGSLGILAPADHVVLRGSELSGNRLTGGMGMGSEGEGVVSHALVYANRIHDNGDVEADHDQDVHGIAVGRGVEHLWVLDNEMWANSGDGIQINGGKGGEEVTHHLYVGRNRSHHNKQTGFWTKQAADVVFSENESWGHRPSNSSMGQGMGFQYAPERVWFLFNHVHDCDYGIVAASDNDLGTGTESYFIGNLVHGIHHSGGYNPATAWSNAALMLAGGVHRFVVHNTIHDVDAGITSPGHGGGLHIVNNVISGVTQPEGRHVFLEFESLASRSVLWHNLFEPGARFNWGGFTAGSLAALKARFPEHARGSLSGPPGFVEPGRDFRLLAGSLAVDAGTDSDAYLAFRTRYGLDVTRDRAGTSRPQGRAPDAGAYELVPGPIGTNRLATESDTEVIVHLYEDHGDMGAR